MITTGTITKQSECLVKRCELLLVLSRTTSSRYLMYHKVVLLLVVSTSTQGKVTTSMYVIDVGSAQNLKKRKNYVPLLHT